MNTFNITIGNETHNSISLDDLCSVICNTLNNGLNTAIVVITTNSISVPVISPDNKLATILDFDKCKALIEQAVANHETCVILCPNYSINVQSKYEEGEELQFDLDELEQYIGYTVEVSDYNDLIVDLTDYYTN